MIWNIEGKEVKIKLKKKKKGGSLLHKIAYQILRELYPFDQIFQEVFLPKVKLYIDILLETRKLIIEINGPQHYEFIEHFHQNKLNFVKAQARDRKKKQISEDNGFKVISLKYNEQDQWKQQIMQNNS